MVTKQILLSHDTTTLEEFFELIFKIVVCEEFIADPYAFFLLLLMAGCALFP
jgi:hypothetical protein